MARLLCLLSITFFAAFITLSTATKPFRRRYGRRRIHSLNPPTLRYDSQNGRFFVTTDTKPTISVHWDKLVQNLVAKAKEGPTSASSAYVIMHTSIFRAWKYTKRYSRRDRECSVKFLSMHYAANFALLRLFPGDKAVIVRARTTAVRGCPRSYRKRAMRIGRRVARDVFKLYNTNVLPPQSSDDDDTPWPRNKIEKWRPERVPIDSKTGPIQKALAPGWGRRYTFSVPNGNSMTAPPPKRFLTVDGEYDEKTQTVTLASGKTIPFSSNLINPAFIAQAKVVAATSASLTAKQRFSAEAWEAGGGSSFPPGSWLTITQWVSARDGNSIDEDVGLFYVVSNALSDAGVITWALKYKYDYPRPVRVIRDLGEMGIFDNLQCYDPLRSRVVTISAQQFLTYQQPSNEPSPSFPEYTSGHSTFSGSAAQVLKLWTGSDEFGASVMLNAKNSRFERGRAPHTNVKLSWKTFTEAADDAGQSRIYGGIHFDDANIEGLKIGRLLGQKAFRKAFPIWKKSLRRTSRRTTHSRRHRRKLRRVRRRLREYLESW